MRRLFLPFFTGQLQPSFYGNEWQRLVRFFFSQALRGQDLVTGDVVDSVVTLPANHKSIGVPQSDNIPCPAPETYIAIALENW